MFARVHDSNIVWRLVLVVCSAASLSGHLFNIVLPLSLQKPRSLHLMRNL
jgi:hypothetical protein